MVGGDSVRLTDRAKLFSPREHGAHVADGPQGPPDCPGDLGLSGTRAIDDIDLTEAPTSVGRPQDHFQRVAKPPVGQPEVDQGPTPGRAHRAEIMDAYPAAG